MHIETKYDLKKIDEIKDHIRSLEDELRTIKENCKHHNKKPDLVETFAFDLLAVYKCVVCGHYDYKVVNKNDQKKLWLEWCPDWSEKEIEDIIKNGGYKEPQLWK